MCHDDLMGRFVANMGIRVFDFKFFFFLISIKKQRLEMPNLIVEVSNCLIVFGKHGNMEEFE